MFNDLEKMDPVKLAWLDWLAEMAVQRPNQGIESGEFLVGQWGLSKVAAVHLSKSLDAAGLVRDCSTHGGPAAMLDEGGRELVTQLRKHRADPKVRVAAARKALLTFLYEHELGRPGFPADPVQVAQSEKAQFLGSRLTTDEIVREVAYLAEWRLVAIRGVKASGQPYSVQLTALGRDCVDQAGGEVAEFLRERPRPSTTINNHVGAVHGASNVAIGNEQVSQSAIVGAGSADLLELVANMRQQLALFKENEPQAREVLADVEAEAEREQPDASRVQQALTKLLDLASQAGVGPGGELPVGEAGAGVDVVGLKVRYPAGYRTG